VTAVYAEADMTGDGLNDIVIGRDNGSFEVYGQDANGEPTRVFEKEGPEPNCCLASACWLSPVDCWLIESLFTHRILLPDTAA